MSDAVNALSSMLGNGASISVYHLKASTDSGKIKWAEVQVQASDWPEPIALPSYLTHAFPTYVEEQFLDEIRRLCGMLNHDPDAVVGALVARSRTKAFSEFAANVEAVRSLAFAAMAEAGVEQLDIPAHLGAGDSPSMSLP